MSEITATTGKIPECPSCSLKHTTDAKHHSDFNPEIKAELTKAQLKIANYMELSPEKLKEYEKVRKVEHILEDYLTVLRELRHKIVKTCPHSNPHNPNPKVEEREVIIEGKKYLQRIEEVKPKEYFEEESFRTLAPKCPLMRPELCPEEIRAKTTRVIIGCPKDQWDRERKLCKVATETHVVYHELKPIE